MKSGLDAELGVDAPEVVLDGVGTQVQSARDLAVGQSVTDEREDVPFARGERGHQGFAAVLRVLPESGPRRRLVRRQLAADRRRACAALAVLTVLFGASLGYVTLLDTLIRTAERQSYPEVLPGQVLLAGTRSHTLPPSEALLRRRSARLEERQRRHHRHGRARRPRRPRG